ncbi:HNH endonuclease [Planctobacterium marinum]|uniref:HNH endonuclease n=2 Tax=Planctobacterium marinum TaxID=1631968 RepID=UPI0030DA8FA4
MEKTMKGQDSNLDFYNAHYDIIGQWLVRPGDKVVLGDRDNRSCRFCGKTTPEVTFKKVAHAIPELLGNKSIESAYECDTCNKGFGQGIENDLGNWSKAMRTLVRIRGKSGVPTLKKGGDKPGWRIEYDQSRLNITAYENDPIFEVDEENKTVTFKLRRDSYTPVAVLKAFMKIGITLLPDSEIPNFSGLMRWVKEPDHSKAYINKCPVIYAFQPGPMPNDLITALILRRKSTVTGYPYAFLVLGYGNEVFQVVLPSEKNDNQMNGKSVSIPPFPVPGHPDQGRYGQPRTTVLDWMDSEVRKGEIMTMQMGFDDRFPVEFPESE